MNGTPVKHKALPQGCRRKIQSESEGHERTALVLLCQGRWGNLYIGILTIHLSHLNWLGRRRQPR